MPCYSPCHVSPYCHPAARARAQSGFSLIEGSRILRCPKRAPSTARPLSRGPWALIGLPFSVWTGACYWHGVGGSMFNSSSSDTPGSRIKAPAVEKFAWLPVGDPAARIGGQGACELARYPVVRALATGTAWAGLKKKKNYTLENPPMPCHLASARQHPENQKESQADHSPERAVEGPLECGIALGSQPGSCHGSCLLAGHQQNRTRRRG